MHFMRNRFHMPQGCWGLALRLPVLLALLSQSLLAHQTAQGVKLELSCEPEELCWGDELSILGSGENTGEAITVDFYIAVVTPSSEFLYLPGGAVAEPRISNLTLPAGSSFSDFELFSGQASRGLPAGEYQWILAAVPSGTGGVLTQAASSMKLGYDCWEAFTALNAVQSLFLEGDSIWIGTLNGGVAKYDLTTGQHVRYGMSEGLASSEVNDFCVDGNANLWAATGYCTYDGDSTLTWGGISRLDGTSWTSFYPDYDNYNPYLASRGGDYIKVLAYSSVDDAVYAVSRGSELLRIVGDLKQVVGCPHSARWVTSCPDGSVCVLTSWSESGDENLTFNLYGLAGDVWTQLAEGGYEPVFVASDGSIWCSSEDYGLFRLRDDGSWESIEQLEGCRIWKIMEAQGMLWVLSRDRLFVWDGSAWMSEELPFSNYGRALAVSETGTAYVGFDDGLFSYKDGAWALVALDSPYYIPFPFQQYEGVSDVAFRGSEAFIVRWPYVSRFDGLSWSALPPLSQPYRPIWDDASLFVDSDGTLWDYGWHNGSFVLAALKDGQWEVFFADEWCDGTPSIAQDASGALWLYSIGRNYPNDAVCVCEGALGLQRFDNIFDAVEERYEILCASEVKTDIWLLDPAGEVVWVTLVQPEGPYHSRVVPASYDGQSWVSYESALPAGGQIRAFRDFDNRWRLDIDKGGHIWTLTDLGLCRLDRSTVWYEPSGRTDDLAPPLHVDNYGNVWISAEFQPHLRAPFEHRGLARYNIDEGEWEDFTERDVPICDWIHNIRSAPNGDVWFCTWEGATRYSQGPK